MKELHLRIEERAHLCFQKPTQNQRMSSKICICKLGNLRLFLTGNTKIQNLASNIVFSRPSAFEGTPSTFGSTKREPFYDTPMIVEEIAPWEYVEIWGWSGSTVSAHCSQSCQAFEFLRCGKSKRLRNVVANFVSRTTESEIIEFFD